MEQLDGNRRQYPRVKAPIFFSPLDVYAPKKQVFDIGLGGVKIQSDHQVRVGERLSIDLHLPDESSLRCHAKVMWLESTANNGHSAFNMGLQFVEVTQQDLKRLASIID
jgi:Tfp pilus assembly protein PilZ